MFKFSMFWMQLSHYIPNIPSLINFFNIISRENFSPESKYLLPIKKTPIRIFSCNEFVKSNAMEITLIFRGFLRVFFKYSNFQCFECNVFAFSFSLTRIPSFWIWNEQHFVLNPFFSHFVTKEFENDV